MTTPHQFGHAEFATPGIPSKENAAPSGTVSTSESQYQTGGQGVPGTGQEPLSGVTGEGASGQPMDAGNADGM